MIRAIASLLAAVVAGCVSPAWAGVRQSQPAGVRDLGVLDLTAAEATRRITLDPNARTVIVRNIVVGRPLRVDATQLNITLPEGAVKAATAVDVRISGIQSNTGANTRLIISVAEGVRIRQLEIIRDAQAATDPIVEIAMAERSSVGQVRLTGGRYRSILLRPDSTNVGTPGASAVIEISGVKLSDLTIAGSDFGTPQPITMNIDAELVKPLYDVKVNDFRLDNLQLRGTASIGLRLPKEEARTRGDGAKSCETAGRVVAFKVFRVIVGDQRGRFDGRGTSSLFELRLDERTCLTQLLLQDMSLYGDVSIDGGTLSNLAIDNVTDVTGGRVELQFASVQALNFGTASLNQLQLNATEQSGRPVIDQWGYVRVNERLALPNAVYDAMSTSMMNEPDQKTSGIRNFLVDVRWKSFTSDPPAERAAPDVLMAVLNSDAREIYGPAISGLLWFTTGYGKNLWLPTICLGVLIFSPFVVALISWAIGKVRGGADSFTSPVAYYSALIAGDNTALLATHPKLAYVVAVHRLLIAVEVGLVALFIQNAVLTGT